MLELVPGQVVTPGEGLVAQFALERPLPRVQQLVDLQSAPGKKKPKKLDYKSNDFQKYFRVKKRLTSVTDPLEVPKGKTNDDAI